MSKETCRHKQLVSGVATVVADKQLTICDLNATFGQILALDRDACLPGMPLAPLLPPALSDVFVNQLPGDHEVTTFDAQGDPKHWHVHLQDVPANTYTPSAMRNILIFDVTDLRENWREAELEKQHYQLLNTVSDDILFEYSIDVDVITFSGRFEETFGMPQALFQFKQYVAGAADNNIAAAFRDELSRPHAVSEKTYKEWHADTLQGECWFLVTFHCIDLENGIAQRLAGTIRNIDAQKKEQVSLINQTQRDPMTGLLNKIAAENEIQSFLSDIGEDRIGVLMILDIDNFRYINDTMGHLAGDSVLQQIAMQLRSLFRKQDIIGRVGGDEFVVFMSHVTEAALITQKAEMLCSSIRKMFINSNLEHNISLSVGISFAKRPISYEELFNEADIALYHAKSHGKNRFEIFGSTSKAMIPVGQPPSPLVHNAVRNNIMVEIIDILFGIDNMQNEIDRALYFIGNAFRVDKIFIAEKNVDMSLVSITYEWALKEEWLSAHRYQNIPCQSFFLPETNATGIFYCTDASILEGHNREFLEREGVTSIVQCAIILDGAEVGYVGFEERGSNRIWTQQEVDTLVLMSKLLGEYIRRQRANNLLASKNEATRTILNCLSHTIVYVLSQDTHQLLYYNDTAKRMFPNITLGVKCHKVFWKRLEPCATCPIGQMDVTYPVTSLFYDSPFWPVTQMTAYPLIWDNNIPAHVVLLSEYCAIPVSKIRTGGEIFLQGLLQNHEDIIDVNPDTGRYALLSPAISISVPLPHEGDYRELILYIAEHYIEPIYRDTFLQHFSLESMILAFANGAHEIEMEFERSTASGQRWKRRRAFSVTIDGTTHILMYSSDITTQKGEGHNLINALQHDSRGIIDKDCPAGVHLTHRDIAAQKKSEKSAELYELHTALRDSYDEIYEIDLNKNSVVLVSSESQILIPIDEEIFTNLQNVASEFIHPTDRPRFIDCFLSTNIQQRFANGQKEICADYRRLTINNQYRWVTSTLVPVEQDDVLVTGKALLLVKDISEQKKEDQRRRILDQYDRALRNIYDEVYELNVAQDSYRILYKLEGKYISPPDEGVLSEELRNVGEYMIHPDDKLRYLQLFDMDKIRNHFAVDKDCLIGEFRKLRINGQFQWASLTLFPVESTQVNEETYLVFVMDIEAKKAAEEISQQKVSLENQRRTDERYKAIVKQTDTLVFEWFPVENLRYIAPEILQRFAGNYDVSRDVIDTWLEDNVIHAEDLDKFLQLKHEVYSGQEYSEQTVRLRTRDGSFRWIKISFTNLPQDNDHAERIIGTLNDVDETTRAALILKFRAEYDTLTGVYNAQTFYANATSMMKQASTRPYFVIRMDIDRFKVINDIYGLEEGDKLLRSLANLLSDHFADQAVFGRISGDIFCICVNYDIDSITTRINAIVKGLEHYPLPYKIAVSFGICKVDSASTPINILCDWASLAAKTIKGNILQRYAFYDETLRVQLLEEKKIESEMNDALLAGQFVMYLQPKVDIATSHIIGAEALVRWIHPVDGLIPPGRFIPLFEKNGFITRLDEHVWEQACIVLRKWLDADYCPGPISVNVSRMHFHGNSLSDKLLKLVERYQIPPELLELEVTETAFMESHFDVGDIMRSLQAHGFRFSMDDFGSGYSSLTMLKSLPINIIKIDREFLNENVSSGNGQIIIRHTISMAQQMKLRVIAEGVETLDQALFLLESGCGYAQGFLYSRPVPVEDFAKLAFSSELPFLPAALKPSNYKPKA